MAISVPITALVTVILTVLVYSLTFYCIISKRGYSSSPTVTSLEMKDNMAYSHISIGTSENTPTKSALYDSITTWVYFSYILCCFYHCLITLSNSLVIVNYSKSVTVTDYFLDLVINMSSSQIKSTYVIDECWYNICTQRWKWDCKTKRKKVTHALKATHLDY